MEMHYIFFGKIFGVKMQDFFISIFGVWFTKFCIAIKLDLDLKAKFGFL